MELIQFTSLILYFIFPALTIFGVMLLIRRKREKDAGRVPKNTTISIKEEEVKKTY